MADARYVRGGDQGPVLVIPADVCAQLHVLLERAFHAELARGQLVPEELHDVAESARVAAAVHTLQGFPHGEISRDTAAATRAAWVSTAEASEVLEVSPRAVRQRAARGEIPSRMLAGRMLVSLSTKGGA